MPLWITAGWPSLGSAPLAEPWDRRAPDEPKGSRAKALRAQGQHREVSPRNQENSSPPALQLLEPQGLPHQHCSSAAPKPAVPWDVGTSVLSLWDHRCHMEGGIPCCSIPVMPCKLIFFPLEMLGNLLSRLCEGRQDGHLACGPKVPHG